MLPLIRASIRSEEGASAGALAEAIRGLGYEVPTETVRLPARGTPCASCMAKRESGLGTRLPGILPASVNFVAEQVAVAYVPGRITLEDLRRSIRQTLFSHAYNTALFPVAAGGLFPVFGWLLNPILAAAAMAISVSVVSNARRRRFRPPVL